MKEEKLFYLMHKDIPVCSMLLSDDGEISSVDIITSNFDHFPIAGKMNNSKFVEWWKSRYIPENRDGLNNALTRLGYKSRGNALIDNLALSLTDCYWIKPRGTFLCWDKVNLFTNSFVDSIGELTFDITSKNNKHNNHFGVASSSGELKKKWCIDNDNKRYLIKGNVANSYQQSLNEILISKVHEQNNKEFALNYELCDITVEGNRKIHGCKCMNFCNENVEFVSAWDLIQSEKLNGSDNLFSLFKTACLKLGMNEDYFHNYMDYLILTDYLFSNIDRHMNNIGILRNPDTLKLIGFAPIYDSGNSMFYNIAFEELKTIDLNKIKIHSFFEKETKLLSYVKNKNRIDVANIKPDFTIYNNDIKENQIRYPIIKELFEKKKRMLMKFINN